MRNVVLYVVLFALFFGIRLFDLGRDTFNTDVWKWKARTYNFLNSVSTFDLSGTAQSYHPGYTLMVLGSLGVKTYSFQQKVILKSEVRDDITTIFGVHFWQKFYVVGLTSLIFTLSFYFIQRLYGLFPAAFFFILINTEPFFVAHTREFHLEGLVASFMFLSGLLISDLLSNFKGPDISIAKSIKFILSAFFAALTLLTKSSGFFVMPFAGLLFLLHFGKKGLLVPIKISGLFFLEMLLFVFLLWPAMWVKPVETIQLYYRGVSEIGVEGDHEQLYFGKLVSDPGASFYFLNLFLRTSPFVLISFMVSVFFSFKRLLKLESLSILFVLFFLVFLTLPTKKLDRYLIPLYPFLVLEAALFIASLSDRWKKGMVVGALLIVLRLPVMFWFHPDYLMYYSSLSGGPQKSFEIVEPKWAFGGGELGKFFDALIKNTSSEIVVAFPEKYYTQLWPFVNSKSVIMDIKRESDRATHFVFPVWNDTSGKFKTSYSLTLLDYVRVKNVKVFVIYKKNETT